MTTPLYPLTNKKLKELEREVSTRLDAWRMFCARWQLSSTDFHGKPIMYEGIRFEGSPRHVFWAGLFEPFMEDAATKLLSWVLEHCKSHQLDPPIYLVEARGLLYGYIERTYLRMSEIDQILRGSGYPNAVSKVDVSEKIRVMQQHLDDLLLAMNHQGHVPIAKKAPPPPSVFKLEPNIYGIGISLPVLWGRVKAWWGR